MWEHASQATTHISCVSITSRIAQRKNCDEKNQTNKAKRFWGSHEVVFQKYPHRGILHRDVRGRMTTSLQVKMLWDILSLHPRQSGVSPDEIWRELRLMHFAPFSGKACKSQLHLREISEILFFFVCWETVNEAQLLKALFVCSHRNVPAGLLGLPRHHAKHRRGGRHDGRRGDARRPLQWGATAQ